VESWFHVISVCWRQMAGFLEEILMYFSLVCIGVCVQCICSLLSLFDALILVLSCCQWGLCSQSVFWHHLPCGWSETFWSRRILNTLQQWRVWHCLNGAYMASIDFHIWVHLYYLWSPIRAQQALQSLELLEHSWSYFLSDGLPGLCARSLLSSV